MLPGAVVTSELHEPALYVCCSVCCSVNLLQCVMQRCRHFLLQCVLQRCRHLPSAGRQRFTRGDLLEKEFFCFLFYYFTIFLSGTLFETTHEPSSLEEGTLAEDDSGLPCP